VSFLPTVTRAEHQGEYFVRVTFNDNSQKTIDFLPWLDGPIFEALRSPRCFRQFFLDGGTIAWPNGADIAPETLYSAPAVERSPKSGRRARARGGEVLVLRRTKANRRKL